MYNKMSVIVWILLIVVTTTIQIFTGCVESHVVEVYEQ
jgi:hypothetical protein